MTTLQEQLLALYDKNPDKNYEILEGEIREVLENEGIIIRERPLEFSPAVQRKYFGASAEDWKFPESVDISSEDYELPEGKQIHSYAITNPYTLEERIIHELRDIYVPPPPSNQEIGQRITQEVYDGNPFAQIADLAKAQITTLALLTPIIGKETIKVSYTDMIESVRRVSDERVKNGLSPYDLSFLD